MSLSEAEAIQGVLGRRLRYESGMYWFPDSKDFMDAGKCGPRIWFNQECLINRVRGTDINYQGTRLDSGDSKSRVEQLLGQPESQLEYNETTALRVLVTRYPGLRLAVQYHKPEDAEPTAIAFLLDNDEKSLNFSETGH